METIIKIDNIVKIKMYDVFQSHKDDLLAKEQKFLRYKLHLLDRIAYTPKYNSRNNKGKLDSIDNNE